MVKVNLANLKENIKANHQCHWCPFFHFFSFNFQELSFPSMTDIKKFLQVIKLFKDPILKCFIALKEIEKINQQKIRCILT